MMNSQQQGIRKAPFIYPEYLSQMTAKMKPKKTVEEQSPIISAMIQGLGDTTNIDDLKRTPSSSTATTAGETTSSALPPKTQYYPKQQQQRAAQHYQAKNQDDSITAASDALHAQPLLYTSTHPMNRSMFMNQQRTPMGGFMSNAFSGGFSTLFSRKPIIPEHGEAIMDENKDDQSVTSTASSTRRLLFPENPIMLMPTPSKGGSMTPNRSYKRSSSYKSPRKTPTRTPTRSASTRSVTASPTISPLPPPSMPSSPFRSLGKALRLSSSSGLVENIVEGVVPSPPRDSPPMQPAPPARTISASSGTVSVTSTTSNFSTTSNRPKVAHVLREPPKIRVKRQNKSPKNTCASCVCRDAKLVDQRKEIDHLKDVIQDLLVLSMESRDNQSADDDSLEDLPPPAILEERAPHNGDLVQAAEMALSPSRQTFAPDPNDPLRKDQVSSTTAMLQMSHSLQVKQAFKRGSPTKMPSKIRHLRIQVNGNWGYYSGPTPEADLTLVGCVVRFDNGDLYLGNMENSCFHGPGTYYPKGGKAFRGTFCYNQLENDDDDYSC